MSRVTLDNDLRKKLNGLNESMEVCDESGRTVGHFLPAAVYEDLFYAALAAECPHSKDELKRRHQETGGRFPCGDLGEAGEGLMDTVFWRPSAERDLAALWNAAPDRAEITSAADALDLALKQDPLVVGEERSGVTRIALV